MSRVLIIEDEPNSREAIETFLGELGYDVRSTGDGAEAVGIGKEFRPDVLICDWMLKGEIDGVSAARQLFAYNAASLIVFVTGLPTSELAAKACDLPVSRVLAKPVSLSTLAKLLSELLGPGAVNGEEPQ